MADSYYESQHKGNEIDEQITYVKNVVRDKIGNHETRIEKLEADALYADSTWNVPDLVKFKGAIELDSDTYTTAKLNAKNASLFDTLESPLRGMYWYYVKAKTLDGYTQDSSGNPVQSPYYMPWGILIDVPYPFDGENIEQAEQKEGNPNVIPSPVIDDGSSYTRLQRLELMTSPTSEKRRIFVRRLVRTPDILGNYGEPEWEEWKKADAELATKKYVDSKISAEKVSVVDSLTDESSDKALSANQGKILNEKIAGLEQTAKSYTDEEIKKVNWNDSAVIEHKGTIDCTDVEYTGSDNPDLQQHYFSDNNILSAEACLKRLSELKFDAISEGAVADGKRYHYWALLKLYPAEFSGSTVCEFIDDRAGIVANDGSYDSGHVRIFIINDNGIRRAFKQEYSFSYNETGSAVYDWTDWERICIGEYDIADSAVTTEKLRNKAVTTAKIADNAITAGKLNDDIFSLAAEKAKAIPHTTAEGQSVKITDQLAGENLLGCKVWGGCGINLFDKNKSTHTAIKNETEFKAYGVTVYDSIATKAMLKPSTKYTVSCDIEITSVPDATVYNFVDNTAMFGFIVYDSAHPSAGASINVSMAFSDLVVGATSHQVMKFTAPATLGAEGYSFNILGYTKLYQKIEGTGSTCLGVIFKNIQFVEGEYTTETMPSYQAYMNVGDLNSATGKYTVSLKIFGKNMLKIISGYSTNGGSLTTTRIQKNSKGIIAIAKVVPNSKYTYTSSKSASDERYFFFENNPIDTSEVAVGGVYGPVRKPYIITIPDNVNYIVFRVTTDGVNITENLQLESGTTATEYEPYTETTATAVLDTALGENDYIDIIEKKRYTNGTEVSDITVEGELKTADSSKCEIECQTNVQPSKISTEYYQDINKVITEIKNAVLSQGGNV